MEKLLAFLKALGLKSGMPEDEVEKLLAGTAEGGSDDDILGGDKGGTMPFDVTKLDQEAQDAFAALETERNDAVAEIVTLKEGGDKKVEKLPDDVPDNIAKLFEGLEARLEKSDERATEAEATVTKMVDAQIDREFIAKTAKLTSMPGVSPDDFAGVYRKAVEGMTDEEVVKFEEVMTAANAAIEKGSLFAEVGRGGQGVTSTQAEVKALADEFKKADPTLTDDMARAKVWESRKDLYAKYEAERKGILKRAQQEG